jgi:hypothetical protein
MSFQEALKFLNIEDFAERIFNSNSHGELFHLQDYISIAESFKNSNTDELVFRTWFLAVVKNAERTSPNPEFVFQHIQKILISYIENLNKN